MTNSNFSQTKDLFTLNSLKCLRNEYFFNDCTLCFSQCETNALGLHKDKITLFRDQCTSCAECLGICPTEALSIDSFDVNHFVLTFCENDQNKIIEKIEIPTFSMFDTYHLISIVLRKKANIFLEYNKNINKLSREYIENIIEESNYYLRLMGREDSLFLKMHEPILEDNERRNLFTHLTQRNREFKEDQSLSLKLNEYEKTLPSKVILLKNSLKLVCEDLYTTKISIDNKSLFFNKIISYEACTNCVDCITFCPTQALFQNTAKDQIYFSSGKCIGCDICQEVCKTNAISEQQEIDLIEFAFNKARCEVSFNYEVCQECNTPFVFKGQSKICDRCKSYKTDFQDMFTLAKDM